MGNYKENPKYNIISIRVTDKEKATLDEMIRATQKNISMIIREAMSHYTALVNGTCKREI
jgi:predicted transcriptional regulator